MANNISLSEILHKRPDVVPTIYGYILPDVKDHDGYIKIGYTDRKDTETRISEGYFSGLQNYLRANNANFQSTNDFFNEKTLIQYYNTSRIEDIWKKLIKKSHCSGDRKSVV